MCFSAEASFIAAAVLGGIGVYSVARTPGRRAAMFRAIPLLFAAHQFVEGLIWRAWATRVSWRLDSWLVRIWLLVALVAWPIWMPISCALLEPLRARRRLLVALTVCGTALGTWLMQHALAQGAWSCVLRGHFYHAVQLVRPMQPFVQAVYLLCVLVPLAVVSARGARRLALALFIAWIACAWVYRTTMISVWCFFSAWLSMLVLTVEIPDGAPRSGAVPTAGEASKIVV